MLNLQPGEVVKDIPGYEEFYMASNFGRVFSKNYRKTGRVHELAQSELTNKGRSSPTKYKRAKMWHIHKYTPTAIHIVVAKTFCDNPHSFPMVNHIDGDKGNNHASNLEWCSASMNIQHACDTGLRKFANGERHHLAKLSEEQAVQIKNELAKTPPFKGQLKSLGDRFGVSLHCIFDIKHGRAWSHLNVCT